MKVFIVILHYGDMRETIRCIKSIGKFEKNYRQIVVVDNTHLLNLSGRLPRNIRKHIIRSKTNLGFAGGVNTGIRYALEKKATHVLLINNDAVLTKGIIKIMMKFFSKNNRAGIVAPAIKFYKNNIKTIDLGGKLNKRLGRTSHINVPKKINNIPSRVDYVSGCCMCIKKDVFNKIGFFDELFFLYYEDVDFCIRARAKKYYSYVLPQISINHKLSRSVGRNSSNAVYHQLRSRILFGKKYNKGINKITNILFICYQSVIMLYKNIHNASAIFRALNDN